MQYFRKGLCLLIVFASAYYALAQPEKAGFSALINTNLSEFSEKVKAGSEPFDEEAWNSLFSEAEKYIFDGDYTKAADYAAKSQILAQTLDNPFLLAKSYRLAGEIKLKKERIYDSLTDFHSSQNALIKADKMPQNIVAAEYARLILDVAETQATDRLLNSNEELGKAFLNVGSIIKYCEQYPNDKVFDELKTTALIKQARIMEMEEHYPAEIILLEQIDTARLVGSNQVLNIYELNIGLLRAYRAIGNYEKSFESLRQIEKLFFRLPFAEKSLFLREQVEFYTDTNNLPERDRVLEQARKLAENSGNKYSLGVIASAQMLVLMRNQRFAEAEKYFLDLKEFSREPEALINPLDLAVAGAVFASMRGEGAEGAKKFLEADRILEEFNDDPRNARFLFYWKSFVASNEKRFDDLKQISLQYLKLAEDTGKIDALPEIYFNLAKANYEQKNYESAQEYNNQVLSLIEQKRNSKYANISIGVSELSHRAYELEISLDLVNKNISSAFQNAEKSKGRFLADKLSGSKNKSVEIVESARTEILETAKAKAASPGDKNLDARLFAFEKASVEAVYNTSVSESLGNLLSELQSSPVADDAQIVSYSFNSEDKLIAFTWSRGNGLNAAVLNLSKSQADRLAFETSQKIKNNLYFKQTGKELFDLFLKPLSLSDRVKHLIVIPDGSLWKIPFQAMSASGERYLIEEKQISYAPSLPILLGALKNAKTEAQSAAVFANSDYQNTKLAFADREATAVAGEFNSKPILDAKVEDFKGLAEKADVMHFSMHAEVNRTNPLDSFLAFHNGKLTVENLLDLKIKKGSLVFLASCNTDNIYNSEGLVSLAWGMTAAGAGAVISSQWEADDEAAGKFTKSFYANYKQGASRAEAIRRAAVEMINNKAGKNKPYYWAEFFLMGDYR